MKFLAACSAVLVIGGASQAATAAPAVYLAKNALACFSAGWLTEVSIRHRPTSEVAAESKGQCWLEFDVPGAHRTRVVPLDAQELPYVFVCSSQRFSEPMAGVRVGFVCGETLAAWLVDERGAPLTEASIRAISGSASMADVRALPP